MRLAALLSLSFFGVAGFATGCTEPVPPSAQGAYLVFFQDTGVDCPQKSHQGVVGAMTKNTRTTLAVDGVDGADVSCTVSGSGNGPYAVDATISVGTNTLVVTIPAISKGTTSAMPAKGQVGFQSLDTADTYGTPNDALCDFYFIEGTPESVDPGKIWVAFQCPKIVNQMSTCALAESFVLLENCDG